MVQLSGRTGQAFAQLLSEEATHAVIENLYLRFDVPPMTSTSNIGGPNKISKATNLVRILRGRHDDSLLELIEYAASKNSRMSNSFRRGSQESLDLYESLDRDLKSSKASSPKPSAAPKQFSRPGTTSSAAAPSHEQAATAKRYVFVVRGRDQKAYEALAKFLRTLDLRIVTWDEATRGVGGGTPHTLDIVRSGIEMSDAVIVLMTPDDLAKVKPEFIQSTDDPREERYTGQARQNVVFEAGWAMALNQNAVVLVRVGDVRNLSDVDGLNYVNLTNDLSARKTLIVRLKNCGLEVEDSDDEWRTAGDFPEN